MNGYLSVPVSFNVRRGPRPSSVANALPFLVLMSAKSRCWLESYSSGTRLSANCSSRLGIFQFPSVPVKLRSWSTILKEPCSCGTPCSDTGPLYVGCGVNVRFRSSPLHDASDPFHMPTSCPRKLSLSTTFDPPWLVRGTSFDPLPITWPGLLYDRRGSFQTPERSNS